MYMYPTIDADDCTYVYEYMLKTYYMQLPFSTFECDMLTIMNVAPSQLHPNSWPFLELSKFCVTSSIKFMFFYQLKYGF